LGRILEAKPSPQSSTSGEGSIQDYHNLNGEYSLLSYNVNQRAVISYVLYFPFGNKPPCAEPFAPTPYLEMEQFSCAKCAAFFAKS